ncbi:MAG: carbohydrate binding domain-containing protein [Eubacterium sp.]|nr:carbohydrate binding domain-containing protein [Eubacterium sp.]
MTLRSKKSIKKAFALTLCFALATPYAGLAGNVNAAEAVQTAPEFVEDYDKYSLVWSDEFEGDKLNTDDWNVELHEPGWVNAELQRYTRLDEGNIKVEDGKLKLIPKAEKKENVSSEGKEVLDSNAFDSSWVMGAYEGAKAELDVSGGVAAVSISDPGKANWHVQYQKPGLTLVEGHDYKVILKAKADIKRKIEVNISNTDTYASYGNKIVTADETKETFEYVFTMGKADEGKTAIQLNMGLVDDTEAGGARTTIELSEISLIDLTDKSTDVKKEYSYTSGRVNTQDKHDFTYGYFECAARVPEGMGYLPAFWLMATDEGNYGQWPRCGEVDIMEVMGQNTKQSYHTIHYGYDANSGHRENQHKKVLEDGDFSSEYHVYGLDWEPGQMTWYVDGEKVGSTNDWYTGKSDEAKLSYPAPFDQDFYVILNLAVGGSWVGYPDQTVVDDMDNQSYDIDYVRVYQKTPESYAEMEEDLKEPEHVVSYREADEAGNYVVNGNFSKDLKAMDAEGDNFELHLESDCLDSTDYSIKDNVLKISQTNTGSQNHSVQLKQTGIPMFKGWEYELKFKACADEARTIIVDLEGPDHGWKRYFNDTEVSLTDEMTEYTYTFTMEDKTDANGSLEFNLGNQDSTSPVYISDISLVHKSGEEIEEVFEKSVAADGNYVYNGSFDQGEGRLGYWEVDEADAANVSVTNTKAEGERKRELRVKVEVPEGASEANPVIVSQSELAPIAKGEYEFSFDAYTPDGERDGMIAIFSGTEYTPELAAEKNNYKYKVSVDENIDRENAKVAFRFTKGGTYYLDNVVFHESAMIKNGSFNSDLAGYNAGVYNGGDATFGVDSQKAGNNTAFDADIKDSGEADWSIQLKQPGITLEEGKWYKLSFKAKATIDRSISVVMQRDGSKDDNWDVYSGDYKINLTSDWSKYSKIFQMKKATDTNALLSVSLGTFDDNRITDVHHVYLDDFVLEEVEERFEEEPTPTGTPSATPTAEPSEEPKATPTSEPSEGPSVTPAATPGADSTEKPSVSPSATPTSTATPSKEVTPSTAPSVKPGKAVVKDKKTTFSIKNKSKVKKYAKIKIKDKNKIKKVTLNGKNVKIRKNKTSVTVKLKSYKKILKKKGKWNKLVVTDKNNKKTTIKFKIK